jgi:hypothetical protein
MIHCATKSVNQWSANDWENNLKNETGDERPTAYLAAKVEVCAMRDLHMHVEVTLALVALVALGALERRAREVHVLHNRVANNFSFSPNSNSSVYVQNTGTGTLPWYNSNSDLWDTRYWTCWFIPKSKIWIWLHCKHFHNYYLLIFYGGLRTVSGYV